MHSSLSLEEIARAGEKYYLETLKEKLEATNFGHYVVIDVEKKDYVVERERLPAITEAKKRFGEKLFYIVQVGMLQQPTTNYLAKKHAWNF